MNRVTRTAAVLTMALVTALPLTQAHADGAAERAEVPVGENLIKNGTFSAETVAPHRYKPYTTGSDARISPWHVMTEGELHVFSKKEAQHPNQYQAANITGNVPVTIEQDAGTISDTRYRLTWQERTETWEGCERKPAADQQYKVAVTGVRAKTYTPTDEWLQPEGGPIDFTARGDTKVQFISQSRNNSDPGHCGALITNVVLRKLQSNES
ncbi:hypothetical protein [Streptomyces silvensis]|uniref:Secreted protein n=1 Tax=Streptomyces silvensis TaxID=1765722 RepID=A0A0W7X9K6_9ACTN|nr:hypothetical protein [Streptomyces silvensis]KUF19203.1 hypothetical protein AT728_21875 [Streptomyces silvensis]